MAQSCYRLFEDGKQAVKCCIKELKKSTAPEDLVQIVIANFKMPTMADFSAIRDIKAFINSTNQRHAADNDNAGSFRPAMKMPTFCMLSGYKSKAFLTHAKAQGVDVILKEPVSPEEIDNLIVKAFTSEL